MYLLCWIVSSKMFIKSKLLIVLVRSMVSLFHFCLEDLTSGERGVLQSPSIIVYGLFGF